MTPVSSNLDCDFVDKKRHRFDMCYHKCRTADRKPVCLHRVHVFQVLDGSLPFETLFAPPGVYEETGINHRCPVQITVARYR